jgi:hypothetical protein
LTESSDRKDQAPPESAAIVLWDRAARVLWKLGVVLFVLVLIAAIWNTVE